MGKLPTKKGSPGIQAVKGPQSVVPATLEDKLNASIAATASKPKNKLLPGASGKDFSEFFTDSEKTFFSGDIVTHGPPKVGKTIFAATESDQWPEDLSSRDASVIGRKAWSKLETIEIRDLLWLTYDAGALDTLAQFKVKVPAINVLALIAKFGPLQGVRMVHQAVRQWLDTHSEYDIKRIVEDTSSAKDRIMQEYCLSNAPIGRDDKPDTQSAYGSLKAAHTQSHNSLRMLGIPMHFLCHSKAAPEARDNAAGDHQRRVDQTIDLPGGGKIEPEITGQSLKMYQGDASLIGVVFATPILGAEGKKETVKFKHEYYPTGGKQFSGGNRFLSLLPRVMEPNMKLVLKYCSGEMADESE